ncbi:PREDICTED: ATP synthase mitochondrial F1 complex assembly factor 1, partial [Nanorana parkeri]|uniref:ATP synthase mitochondrial F1 complex assembly factor 1 n=1 Tax=Nanorana parkeri TaxID=125878 RepID=UPI000854A681
MSRYRYLHRARYRYYTEGACPDDWLSARCLLTSRCRSPPTWRQTAWPPRTPALVLQICPLILWLALSSVLNLDLVKDKSSDEIKQIWKEFFSMKDSVYAVIPGETFDLLWTRAQSCPAFLYALPRAEGYEFFVGQWSGTELHFTSLINIQSVGAAATSQLILRHYTELQKTRGIVLMNSELDSKFLVNVGVACPKGWQSSCVVPPPGE